MLLGLVLQLIRFLFVVGSFVVASLSIFVKHYLSCKLCEKPHTSVLFQFESG